MLVSFSVQNHRSFREEQALSMVAARGMDQHQRHLRPMPGRSSRNVLPAAVVYGANGSGKSNLVMALAVMRHLVLRPLDKEKALVLRRPFALDQRSLGEPSSFVVRFVALERVLEYGFCVSNERVEEEWLCEIRDDEEKKALFEREAGEGGAAKLTLSDEVIRDAPEQVNALKALGVRPDHLFLATVNNTLPREQTPKVLAATLKFFESMTIIEPDAEYGPLIERLHNDAGFRSLVGDFLRAVSTGVAEVEVVEKRRAAEEVPFAADLAPGKVFRTQGQEVRRENDDVIVRALRCLHDCADGQRRRLQYEDESDGTKRLMHLIPALVEPGDGVFVIDELERSLHPLLTYKYIELFLRRCCGSRGQLIVTTHESNLLAQELLRRDEIWFCEKNSAGASSLYSLAEFKVRPDVRLRRGYLQGRFDAIPVFANIDWLMKDAEGAPVSVLQADAE